MKQKYLFNFEGKQFLNTIVEHEESESDESEEEYDEEIKVQKIKEKEYKENLHQIIMDNLKKKKVIYDGLSKSYKDLIDIWMDLDICHFNKYKFDESTCEFKCRIRKKVTSHTGDLWNDYELFLKDIIVPISSFISECSIESDDCGDRIEIYTDMQLRGQRLILNDIIKSIEHISEDGCIVATKIIYKRSIKPTHIIDLNRCFGK